MVGRGEMPDAGWKRSAGRKGAARPEGEGELVLRRLPTGVEWVGARGGEGFPKGLVGPEGGPDMDQRRGVVVGVRACQGRRALSVREVMSRSIAAAPEVPDG